MNIIIRKYNENDLKEMIDLWNEVVEAGIAFPQEELLSYATGKEFFLTQTYCAVAMDSENGKIYGLYILHPNNIGRCKHICNASYAVKKEARGLYIGDELVKDSLTKGRQYGFGILQFNAVVESNIHARHLYERLGFTPLGVIPKGFRLKNGIYENICLYYHEL